jgi:hypothetical protein
MQVIDGEQRTVWDPVAPSEDACILGSSSLRSSSSSASTLLKTASTTTPRTSPRRRGRNPRRDRSRGNRRKSLTDGPGIVGTRNQMPSDEGQSSLRLKAWSAYLFLRNAPSARQRWAVPRETPRSLRNSWRSSRSRTVSSVPGTHWQTPSSMSGARYPGLTPTPFRSPPSAHRPRATGPRGLHSRGRTAQRRRRSAHAFRRIRFSTRFSIALPPPRALTRRTARQ